MAGDKYFYNNSGAITEKAAIQSSAGAGDAGKIPALDAAGLLDTSMMPVGIGADTKAIVATEALAAGDFVNVYDSSGTFKCRKADASTSGKEANGFVLTSVLITANATVYFEGNNTAVTSVSPGVQYLSASVPGGFTTTPPSGAGKTLQRIGLGTSSTSINFESGTPFILAA